MGHTDDLAFRPTGRRGVQVMAVLIVGLLALVAVILVKISNEQDRHAADQARSLAGAAMERRQAAVAKDVHDYAAWGEAYQHLHARTDAAWAFAQQNLGATLFTDLGYEAVVVVGPGNRVTYAVVDGQLAGDGAPAVAGASLDALVATARASSEGKAVAGLVLGPAGQPFLAAAAAITPGGDPTIVPTPGEASVLVLADALTPDRLLAIGQAEFVNGLAVRPGAPARDDAEATLALPLAGGEGTLRLGWEPERPGRAMLGRVLPWFSLAGLCFALLTALVLQAMVRASDAMEASARALARAHRQAEHSALHDGTTGLPNRQMLHRHLSATLAEGGRAGRPAVAFIDLDRFKPVNDALGHRAGDSVLRTVADRLRDGLREGDLAARVGGDEFVVVLAAPGPAREVERACRRMVEAVSAPMLVEGHAVTIGASVGVCVADGATAGAEELLARADLAMYRAKARGGNVVCLHPAEAEAAPLRPGRARPRAAPA